MSVLRVQAPGVALFGFIGRLEEQKGVDILLHALPAVINGTDAQVSRSRPHVNTVSSLPIPIA